MSGLIICKRHQGASVPNEGFATATFNSSGRMLQWMLRLFPIGLEPKSLIRCSEVEGIDRRSKATAI